MRGGEKIDKGSERITYLTNKETLLGDNKKTVSTPFNTDNADLYISKNENPVYMIRCSSTSRWSSGSCEW